MKKEELEKISEMVALLLASKVPFKMSYDHSGFQLTTYKEEALEDRKNKFVKDRWDGNAMLYGTTLTTAPIAPTPKKDYSALDTMYNTQKTEEEIAKETEERNRKLKERFDKTGNVEPSTFSGD